MTSEKERDPDFRVEVPESDSPPNYGSATNSPPMYTDEPPPSYNSVLQELKRAQSQSSGRPDFAKKVLTIVCCGTIAMICVLVCTTALPIAQIVMGALYKDDCPIEKYIPIYNIVAGVFGLALGIINTAERKQSKNNDDGDDEESRGCCSKCLNIFKGLAGCFTLAWFICGNVWVYRIYGDVNYDNENSDDYCHKGLYLFSFWTITVAYIFAGLACLCGICGVIATFTCVKVGEEGED